MSVVSGASHSAAAASPQLYAARHALFWIWTIILVLAVTYTALVVRREDSPKRKWVVHHYFGFEWIALSALAPPLLFTIAISREPRDWLELYHSVYVAPVSILVAGCLFALRLLQRLIYATIEISAALVAIIAASLLSQPNDLQRLITVVTSIYFLIRGLDNFHVGGGFKSFFSFFQDIVSIEKQLVEFDLTWQSNRSKVKIFRNGEWALLDSDRGRELLAMPLDPDKPDQS